MNMTETDVEQIREIRRQAFVGGLDVSSMQAKQLKPDFLDRFYCSRDQLKVLVELTGWRIHYIHDWGHEKDLKIVKLEPNL